MDLTYRADLRELNELNFARFDAKLEQRLAELRAELLTELRQASSDLKAELQRETTQLRIEFRTELHAVRIDLLRWMFGFWATTLLALAGMMVGLR